MRNTCIFNGSELLNEFPGVYCHSVAQNTDSVLVKNAGWHEVESELSKLVLDGVSGVAAALKPNDIIGFLCEYVCDFTLAFITPIGTYNCCDHKNLLTHCALAPLP